jgi:hypothetical protein
MNAPRDHHFIPVFYLSQWAGSDGKLIEFTRKYDKLIPKSVGPRSTGYETDLYQFPDLPPGSSQYLEEVFFNYADDTAARAYRIHLGNGERWNSELISAWSRFVLGVHLRHPDAMPELRIAANSVWETSGADTQAEYEKVKKPGDPETFDEYLAKVDPFASAKIRLNLIIKSFDNDIAGTHINGMRQAVVDVSSSPARFLTSDRPAWFFNLESPDGFLALPLSPTKLFIAANLEETFERMRKSKPVDIVFRVNSFVASRARRFVWAHDRSQEDFIRNVMSTKLESTPLFPTLARYGK